MSGADRRRDRVAGSAEAPDDGRGDAGGPAGEGACLACGAVERRRLGRRAAAYHVVACARCGLGRTEPRPDAQALGALYADDYPASRARGLRGAIDAARRACASALARRIRRRVANPRRALDVGCGDGKLLVALAGRGFGCTGIDRNPHARDAVAAHAGITLHVGTLAAARLPSASFQVVVLRHVLEHVEDPRATLDEVARVIEPGGLLVVAVPNVASWQARGTGDHWFHLDLPRHLHHFTPAALATIVDGSGFTVDRVAHFSLEQNPFGWLQSIVHAAGGGHQALYDRLRGRATAGAAGPRLPVLVAAAMLAPLCLLLAAVESALRAGGTIELWARRRNPTARPSTAPPLRADQST